MAALAPLMIIASVAGTALSAMGTIAQGKAQAAALQAQADQARLQAKYNADVHNWQAAQLEVQGKDEQATAQRQAIQMRREKNLALSRLQATAAGSGFDATSGDVLHNAEEIAKYGTFRENMASYGGQARRREAEYGAAGHRYSAATGQDLANRYALSAESQAASARQVANLSAAGTIASGAGSIFSKFAPYSGGTSDYYRTAGYSPMPSFGFGGYG